MYQSIFYERQTSLMHIWDDRVGYYKFKYKKYAFKLNDAGSWKTLDGKNAELVYKWDDYDIEDGMLYEHDVRPETRTIIDKYLDEDETPDHRTLFFDIEVERDAIHGYSLPSQAKNKITSIACRSGDEKVIFIISDTIKSKKTDEYELRVFNTEYNMLANFMFYFKKLDPTILSGWNIQYFDIPYLINRMRNLNMEFYRISPIGIVTENKEGDAYLIAGRNILDYMYLYKKFSMNEESSYALNAIAKKVVGRGKVEYTGSLQTLYETDIEKFIKYNIEDVDLVFEIDQKLLYLELAIDLVHTCHVAYSDVYYNSLLIDGAALTYLRRRNTVSPSKSINTEEIEKIDGAFVKLPIAGLYDWVFDLDLKALYPTIMQTLNISPETKVGKIQGWDQYALDYIHSEKSFSVTFGDKNMYKMSISDISKLLETEKFAIASNGNMYRTNIRGFIPTILNEWADIRDYHKNEMKQCHKKGDHAGYLKHFIKQYTQKIISNSFYGVLLLNSFRYSDRENGEAITTTGQHIIKHSLHISNLIYNKKLKTQNKDYVIYVDTDSLFLTALPLIQNADQLEESELISKTLEIATEVQTLINKSYDIYAKKYHNVDKHGFQIKQEMVGKTAIWTGVKKRYAIYLVNKEGMSVDEFEFKGIDMVRSDFPAASRKFLTEFVQNILKKVPKETIMSSVSNFHSVHMASKIDEIMFPTSVKDLAKYSSHYGFGKFKTGAPVHVKSALAYNMLIEIFGDSEYPKIPNSEKIKWAYLVQNEFNLDTIGIPSENIHPKIYQFIEKYIDRDKMFSRVSESKIQDFYSVFGWGKINTRQSLDDFF